MTHLTAFMAAASSSSSRRGPSRGSRVRRLRLAREGQAISKFFNEVASRPIPMQVGLEQSIQVSMVIPTATLFTTSSSSAVFSATAFTLSSFADSALYTALFDQYMIEQIEVWIEPMAPQSQTFGSISSVVDLDDATVPTTIAQVDTRAGVLTGMGAAGHYHRWRPHVAVAEFSGTFVSFGNVPSTWIDSASPNVQHYGLKTAAALVVTGVTVATPYEITTRAIVRFRAPGL